MKVDISRKIIVVNDDKLSEEIDKYESQTNQKAYLFMSTDTMDALRLAITPCSNPSMFDGNSPCYFRGRRVYKDDDLDFGEVEIR